MKFSDVFHLSAGWCTGNVLASQAADRGSIPGCGRSASHQTVSVTVTAGDANSLAHRINPPQLVQYLGTEWLGVTEKEISTPDNPKNGSDLALNFVLLYHSYFWEAVTNHSQAML